MTRAGMFLAVAALAALFAAHPARGAVPADWARRWQDDLAFAADTLPRVHANLFHSLPAARFRAEIDSLSARVPRLDHHEIAVELGRIMARIGDGHTRMTFPFDSAAGFFTGHSTTAPAKVPGLVFRHLPVRLRLFRDGLYVVRAGARHRALLGGRVTGIGAMSVGEAIAAVSPVVHRDNERQLQDLLPVYLVVPEILHARRVTDRLERVRLVVETRRGRRESVLAPQPAGEPVDWLDAREPGPPPLAERHPGSRHWFEPVPGTDALYARYREVYDDPGRTIAEFADSLFGTLAATDAGRLILDLRGNVGGDGFLNRPVLHGVIASAELGRPGALFVLADRGTFSAATMLLAQLEENTSAVFVGEKSGGAPNGYGDSRRVRLPATGLTLRVSTLYWQMTDPRDRRDGIPPHVEAEPSFADWRARRDPALDSTLALIGPAGSPEGAWRGEISFGHERYPFALRVPRRDAGHAVPGVRIDLPVLGLKDAPLAGTTFAAGELEFAVSGGETSLRFRGRVTAHAIAGVVRHRGAALPFLLRREPADAGAAR